MDYLTMSVMEKRRHLAAAIKANNPTLVIELLKTGLDINKRSNDPPLCLAVTEGHPVIAALLMSNGADIEVQNTSGLKPLHEASKHGQLDCVRLLLTNGADVNDGVDLGNGALYYAVSNEHVDVAEFLLEAGAEVNQTASFLFSRNTSVHRAAELENPGMLNLLLRANADVCQLNDDKKTPLHLAAVAGYVKNVERLISCGCPIHVRDTEGYSSLMSAAAHGNAEVIKVLAREGASLSGANNLGHNSLHIAALKGHIQVARTMISLGMDPNCVDSNRKTPLHLAITKCSHKMRDKWQSTKEKTSVNKEIEMLDTLVQGGANINHQTSSGETPLHTCIKEGCSFVLEYLINLGADYTLTNDKNHTPLTLACSENVLMATKLLIQLCPGLVNPSTSPFPPPCNPSQPSNPSRNPGAPHRYKLSPLHILTQKHNLEGLQLLHQAGYRCTRDEADACLDYTNGKKIPSNITMWYEKDFMQPRSLQLSCRTVVRDQLKTRIKRKVHKLPIPQKLRESILLRKL